MNRFAYWTIGIILGLIVIFAVAAAVMVRSTRSTVEELHREIVESGDRLVFSEFASDAIPEEENAFYRLLEAESGMDAFLTPFFEIASPEALGGTSEGDEAMTAKKAELETLLAEHEGLFTQLDQIAEYQKYWSDIDYDGGLESKMPQLPLARALARCFSAKARILAMSGKGDEALKACTNCLRILTLLQEDSVIITYLASVASQSQVLSAAHFAMTVTQPSQDAKDEFEAALAALDNTRGLARAMKGERSLGVLTFQQIRDGSLKDEDMPATGLAGTGLGDAYLYDDEATYIQLMNTMISLVGEPKVDRDPIIQQMNEEIENASFRKMVTRMMFPAITQIIDSNDDIETRIRCMRVLLATDDVENVDLDTLPAAIRTDPYSGTNLLVIRRDEGLVVYGVGRNQQDDGGDLDFKNELGIRTPDIGFIVPEHD